MSRNPEPIRHGTRKGYKHGCHANSNCPASPTCTEVETQYGRDLRAAQRAARSRRTSPVTIGQRIAEGKARSEPHINETGPTTPIPDIASVNPPKELLDAQVNPDPAPADMGDAQYSYSDDTPFVITPGIRADAKGKLALFGTLVAVPLDMVDPYCGRVLSDNLDNMIDKAMPLIARSPAAIKFLTSSSGGFLEWIALLQACWPVFMAIYAHHLARTVVRDDKTGRYVKVNKDGNAVDPTMPPAADNYEYSAA
jgi:hypothetical protein